MSILSSPSNHSSSKTPLGILPGSAARQYLSTAVGRLVVSVLWDVRGVVTVGMCMGAVVLVDGGEMWVEEGDGVIGWVVRLAEDIA